MSYHAPHCLNEQDLLELENGEGGVESRFEVTPVDIAGTVGVPGRAVVAETAETAEPGRGVAEAVAAPEAEAEEEKGCRTIWVVYDYDHQSGRYEFPRMAFASEADAREYQRENGWVGVHELDVWRSREAWETAGRPLAEVD